MEVTLALGVASFALVSIFGLLPIGLNMSRNATDNSYGAQIAQRVINDAEQADFSTYIEGGAARIFRKPVRYFGDQGNELTSAQGAIYHVNTRVVVSTGVPVSTGATANPSIATVTIQVANNPGNGILAVEADGSETPMLWNGAYQGGGGNTTVVSYSAHISRNK